MSARWGVAAALVVGLSGPSHGAPSERDGEPGVDLAQRAYEAAFRTQRDAWRERGAERRTALLRAAEAFSALRTGHPAERELVAKASVRAAMLFAQAGALERARAEFELVCSFETEPAWRARGWLERAHLERRAGDHRAALDLYLRAASVEGAPARMRDDASVWAARSHSELGEHQAAQRLAAWVSERARDVFVRIRAFDEWALAFVRQGDPAAAAAVLARARDATRAISFELTPRGARVLLALSRMRCIAALERSVARGEHEHGGE